MSDVVVQRNSQEIRVSVGGGVGPRGFASGPLGADSVGAEEINAADYNALRAKLGITGSIISLSADATIDVFSPRPGDAFVLNGRTLTINRMADTGRSNIFRGAGTVIIKSGFAYPEWWEGVSYVKAATAMHLGGGGTVAFLSRRYAAEATHVTPLKVSRVRLLGSALPSYANGFTTLADGTILDGDVVFSSVDDAGNVVGDGVSVENLGIDSGAVVCGEGPAREGLTIANTGQRADGTVRLRESIRIQNVVVLCKNAAAAVHCILIEQATGAIVRDFRTVFGENGVVGKTRDSLYENGDMRGHATNSWIDKSDKYSRSFGNTWRKLRMFSINGRDTFGGRIQCGSALSSGHVVDDVQAVNTTAIVSIEPLLDPNNPAIVKFPVTDIALSKIKGDDIRFYGVIIGKGASAIAIHGLRATNIVDVADGSEGNALKISSGVDNVTVTGFQSETTAGDGIRNAGTNVRVAAAVAANPGANRFGFNGVAGEMKVAASTGTSTGAVIVS